MVTAHQAQSAILLLILMTLIVVSSAASRTSFGVHPSSLAGVFSKATPVVSRPVFQQTGTSTEPAPRPDVNPVLAIPTELSSPFAS